MTPAVRGNDFFDWLSPMLVKELRQGMRSRGFMAAFFITQLLMILSVVYNLLSNDSNTPGENATLLFWFMIAAPLLFATPMRGFSALYSEMKGGTMELVFLTHLSAWRIAAGKWTALMAQNLLLLCAVLPFVLLRYFLGGVDIIVELQSLLFLFLASAVLTAATVAASPFESKLLRGLFLVALIVASMWSMGALAVSSASLSGWQIYLCIGVFVPTFIALALEIGGSKIAPPAENHAIRKRLIGLAVLLLSPLLVRAGLGAREIYIATMIFLTAVFIDALAEPLQFVSNIYQRFLRRGILGRVALVFLTPGWASALYYALLVGCIGGIFLKIDDPSNDLALTYLSWFGTILFPAAMIRMVMPGTKNFLGIYVGLQFFLGALTLFVNLMSNVSMDHLTTWLCLIPNCVFLLEISQQLRPEQTTLGATCTVIAIIFSVVILAARTAGPSRGIRAMLKENEGA